MNAMETSSKSDNSIKIMMKGIRRLAPRVDKKVVLCPTDGKFLMYHNLSHIPMQITNFGPLKGIDVKSEESNHKEIVKRNAKTVQKRSNGVFTCQLGNTIWLMQALEILRVALGIDQEELRILKNGQVPSEVRKKKHPRNISQHSVTHGPTSTYIYIYISFKKVSKVSTVEQSGSNSNRKINVPSNIELPQGAVVFEEGSGNNEILLQSLPNENHTEDASNKRDVIEVEYVGKTSLDMTFPAFAKEFLQIHLESVRAHLEIESEDECFVIEGCTECSFQNKKRELGTIRSHPNYQSDGPWRDWVLAKVPKEGRPPFRSNYEMTNSLCQVICFLCLPEPSNTQTNSSTRNQITHAMVQTCAIRTATDKKRSSVLFHRWRKKYNGRTKIADVAIIPVLSILKPVPSLCLVIDNIVELALCGFCLMYFSSSALEQSNPCCVFACISFIFLNSQE